jgi:hypothetical protein
MTEIETDSMDDLFRMTLDDFKAFVSRFGVVPHDEITPAVFASLKRGCLTDAQIELAVINGVTWMNWNIQHYQEHFRRTLLGRIVLFLIKRALKNG